MSSTQPEPRDETGPPEPSAPRGDAEHAASDTTDEGAADALAETETETATATGTSPEVEIEAVMDRTTVRRAPRYKAFFLTGTLAGLVLGGCFAVYLLAQEEAQGMLKPGVYFTVIVLSVTTVTVLLAGLLAILADRRSLRRRGR